MGRGQCIEHYGAGEAYLPLLDALGRLGREPEGAPLLPLLRQYAPTWLVQMPALLSPAEREVLQREVIGATKERMLRELAEALEALTVARGLMLALEDLQWSDVSTLDFLAFVARRREAARLLIVSTYRPVDVVVSGHPLRGIKQELQVHGQCQELALGFLSKEDIAEYLMVRFGAVSSPIPHSALPNPQLHTPLQQLALLLHRRTDGNPLFMVNVVENLVPQGVLVQHAGQWEVQGAIAAIEGGVPENLQQMIEQQVERLSVEEQQVLEVASVAGMEFSAAAVAAGIDPARETGEVETRCEGLARRGQFLQRSGVSEWPDGTVAGRYSFQHALYQEVLYERVSVGRRLELHRQIGARVEKGYGEQAGEIAAELAVHFERGRNYPRAVQYHQQAAQTALRRLAPQEAIRHLTTGLELLKTLPDAPERSQQELTLQITLGSVLMLTKGFGSLEVERAYARALELCQQIGETPSFFPVLRGLGMFYMGKAELETAHEMAEQLLHLAHSANDPARLMEAHEILGLNLFYRGELGSAREHLEQSITLYDKQQYRFLASLQGGDPGVMSLIYAAWALWLCGYPEQARQKIHEALTLAQEMPHPYILATALSFSARLRHFRREAQTAQEQAEAALTLATERGFALWVAVSTMLRGWALAAQGEGEAGRAQISQGLTLYQAIGVKVAQPYYLALLAEGYGRVRRPGEGLSVLTEALALVEKTGERWWEAELYRLKGELTLQQFSVANGG
ncbi:MAG: ATP-binding protein, partial [Candidatus Binatia bacterium]